MLLKKEINKLFKNIQGKQMKRNRIKRYGKNTTSKNLLTGGKGTGI